MLSLRAFSTVFTVTSNADSGPGTLRDALTQAAANGTATKDYIYFNLPDISVTGRTITILTDLPKVSSNLVIDASTQPGPKFGISDAKVQIIAVLNSARTVTCCFNVSNRSLVEIYGFMMDGTNISSATTNGFDAGVYGVLVKNTIIGAPGKGNIVKNLAGVVLASNMDETDTKISENITIRSNIFGLNEDGETLAYASGSSIWADRVRNLSIGGNTAVEGNIIEAQTNIMEDTYDFGINTGDLLVANNFFGVDYTGTKPVYNYTSGTSFSIAAYQLKSVVISNNLFAAQSDIGVGGLNCFFNITGNKFGTDITGKNVLGTFIFPLIISYCNKGGILGGSNPGDENIFSGAYFPEKTQDPGGIVLNVGSPGVEVTGNSFRCNNSHYPYSLALAGDTAYYVTIKNRTATSISGTATPNSRVDLYYSLSCDLCEPEKQFTSVNADATGKWNYAGILSGDNIIASSTFQGTTSEFTRTSVGTDNVKITNACPGGGGGSITGTIPVNTTSVEWVDASGNVVGTKPDLINVDPGKYKLKALSYGCGDSTGYFEVKTKFSLDTSAIKRTEPSCGNPTGAITGLNIINNDPGAPYLIWQDASQKPLGYSIDLSKVPAGSYYLQVKSADSTCSQTFGPFSLKNVTGPNIDQSKDAIQPTNCGQSTGSITGITATGSGTLKYIWWNDQQQTVATTIDLLNQPAGTYKLEVTDDSQCGPVYTSDLTIPETNGIMMDESKAQTGVASCSNNNGSITGITVSGATQYQWTDANNKVVGTAVDLQNVAAGTYTLTASNSFGCTAASKPYVVPQLPPTKYPAYTQNTVNACYGATDGSITVNTDALVKSARWVNAQLQTAGSGPSLTNIGAGDYQLYLTDANGCETYYNTYSIDQLPQLAISGNGTVMNDQCTLGTGSISGITVAGGAEPYTYTWYDANNKMIGTGLSIANIGAGTYMLNVTDSRCGNVKMTYTLTDEPQNIAAPSVSNIALCSSGSAIITVNNPSATAVYRLYANATDTQPIAEQSGGKFVVNAGGNTSFYVSQISGSCESQRAEVKVTVGLSALNIANTFTPNGDGINDYWVINGIANYPAAEVRVFTRNGQKVFYSKGYATPFDGTFEGKKLPEGVYYYIINLHSNCSLLSGSLTIIR